MKKATELALEIAKKANPNGAPQMLWPQIDTDKNKLHFHLVRGLHDENYFSLLTLKLGITFLQKYFFTFIASRLKLLTSFNSRSSIFLSVPSLT
jgi:hypothetical protein